MRYGLCVLLVLFFSGCSPQDPPAGQGGSSAIAPPERQVAHEAAQRNQDTGGNPAADVVQMSDACVPFLAALEPVPHVTLTVKTGSFVSVWDGAEFRGCEIQFVTTDSLRGGMPVPDLDAIEDSDMYRSGWRETREVRADGPGSGFFGLERNEIACVIRWEQPSYLDDQGEIIQADTLSMQIQCRDLRE